MTFSKLAGLLAYGEMVSLPRSIGRAFREANAW